MVKAVLLETKMAFLYLQGENNREKRKCRQKSFLIRPCNQSHAPFLQATLAQSSDPFLSILF